MAQGLTYLDAVKLLGGSGPLMKAADNLLGGVLAVATAGGSEAAISLFDAKTEAIRLGHLVAGKITEVVRGQARYTRNQRLHAAHGVLAVSSFFGSLDDCLATAGLESPGFAREDQLLLVSAARAEGSWPARLLDSEIPAPGPDRGRDRLLDDLTDWYRVLARRLGGNLRGLAVWESASRAAREAADRLLNDVLPELARARYEETARNLAVEVPEFGIWLAELDARAVSRGLEALEAALTRAASDEAPARRRAGLAAVYRAALGDPVLGGTFGELTMPSLAAAYLDPRFRVRPAWLGARPADEDWWRDREVRDDFDDFLATFLTTPQAVEAPMLLLGQPGAGKSSLTRVLAARLPASDYLVVRVVLREVRAEAEIQDQIEQAIRDAIGETVAWADLARDAGSAMPVVLLDGFDELLQATGVHQSDYLQRVAAFQQREAVLGRPAAVLVTSRVAVADRARLPQGSLVVRLEPFGEQQVDRWLATWNAANAGYWAASGRRPLGRDVVLRFPELAGQPLLLQMLALYDATANGLQDAEEFGAVQLYERLLTDFAAREVRRIHDGGPEDELPGLVEQELLRLSVVAFAMFHRLRLWVTTAELDEDLAALGLPAQRRPADGFRGGLTAGQEMVGRFFFIQRAQAVQDDQTLQTYEFLHATFGEYLVARLVVQAVREAAAMSRARSFRLGRQDEDDLLQSLLGYTALCARNTVLPFVAELLDTPDRAELTGWVVDRLRSAVTRPSWTPRNYQPVDKRIDHWMATYSFNLFLIAIAGGEAVRAADLFRHAADPAAWLRGTGLQWRAAVPSGMFLDVLESVLVVRAWTEDGRRDVILSGGERTEIAGLDPLWSLGAFPRTPGSGSKLEEWGAADFPVGAAFASMDLTGAFSDDVLRHAAEPVGQLLSTSALLTFVEHAAGDAESVAHSLVRLALASRLGTSGEELSDIYGRASRAVQRRGPDEERLPVDPRWIEFLLRSLLADADRLPPGRVLALAESLTGSVSAHPDLLPLLLECLAVGEANPAVATDPELARMIAGLLTLFGESLSVYDCLRLLEAMPVTPSRGGALLLEAVDRTLRQDFVERFLETDRALTGRLTGGWGGLDSVSPGRAGGTCPGP
ncbi:AAA family ATPase, partial [Actinoplanes sp. NPDC026670]|uniref:NACHT domain-containing protein n=1 Tax=Actinoplanes sp. NPDC026670 TaxID=3154700 RepID=UPI0033FAFB3F